MSASAALFLDTDPATSEVHELVERLESLESFREVIQQTLGGIPENGLVGIDSPTVRAGDFVARLRLTAEPAKLILAALRTIDFDRAHRVLRNEISSE